MAKATCSVFLETTDGRQIDIDAVKESIKKKWLSGGGKVKDMTDFRIYLKPEDNKAYYTLGGVEDSIELL